MTTAMLALSAFSIDIFDRFPKQISKARIPLITGEHINAVCRVLISGPFIQKAFGPWSRTCRLTIAPLGAGTGSAGPPI